MELVEDLGLPPVEGRLINLTANHELLCTKNQPLQLIDPGHINKPSVQSKRQ